MKNKRYILIILFIAAAIVGYSKERTNFVIIFVDDMGYGDAGCYGHPTIKTPELDRMAEEGMRMTQFYVAAPVCTPSRASLLTGRLPVRTGITGVLFPVSKKGLPQNEITIARLLKENGYKTACVGKWHLGHKDGYLPTDHGFDEYYGIPYSNDMYIDSAAPLADDILLREGVTIKNIRANKYKQHNPKYVPLMRQDEVIEFPADQATLTKRYTEEAQAFIRANRRNQFFLYLAHSMPHVPLYVSDKFKDTSLGGLYGDVIEELDWSVGEILKTLSEEGLDSNTLVIFTSDNGPWSQLKFNAPWSQVRFDGGSPGPLRGAKFVTYDGGMRVPCIFYWPGKVSAGKVNREIASSLDVFPTFLDIAGIQIPDDRVMDGYSLKGMLLRNNPSPRKEMFFYSGNKLQAIRYGPWKLHYITKDFGEKPIEHDPPVLYNIENNPGEMYNGEDGNPELFEMFQQLRTKHEESFR